MVSRGGYQGLNDMFTVEKRGDRRGLIQGVEPLEFQDSNGCWKRNDFGC